LCEAAQTAERHPDFAATCQQITRRRGRKITTSSIAQPASGAVSWNLVSSNKVGITWGLIK
jgi:hypothetical protein